MTSTGFLWNKIPAPSTHGIKSNDLPIEMKLGDMDLQLDMNGRWIVAGQPHPPLPAAAAVVAPAPAADEKQIDALQTRIRDLERVNNELQKEKADLDMKLQNVLKANAGSGSDQQKEAAKSLSMTVQMKLEEEKKSVFWESQYTQMKSENDKLMFKNKVLLAMCTVSEGDYLQLCKEAGIAPRAQKFTNRNLDPTQQTLSPAANVVTINQ